MTGPSTGDLTQVGADSCQTDWVTIPCATNSGDPATQNGNPVACVDRICGEIFNSVGSTGTTSVPVFSYSKPFNLFVHTDSLEASGNPPDSNNRGFCLNFVQQPCTASSG